MLFVSVVLVLALLPVTGLRGTFAKNRQRRAQPKVHALTAEEVASKYLAGVVLVVCDDGFGNSVQGSGFFIHRGLVVTNYHVIKGMVRGHVIRTSWGKKRSKLSITSILDFKIRDDLALLHVFADSGKTTGLSPEVAELAEISKGFKATPNTKAQSDSDDPLGIEEFLTDESILPLAPLSETAKVGEKIYALGNPLGLEGTISEGIVSAFRQSATSRLLQITAPISPGSSGGPIVNTKGWVIGVVMASLEEGQNLNFAIPREAIGKLVPRFVEDGRVPGSAPGAWIIPRGLTTP